MIQATSVLLWMVVKSPSKDARINDPQAVAMQEYKLTSGLDTSLSIIRAATPSSA